MSVVVVDGVAHLSGDVRLDEAEAIYSALVGDPERVVDLSRVERMHTAAIQVLLALGAVTRGQPLDPFLREHVLPRLRPSPRTSDRAMTPSGPGGR
jgi:anti-anti-sigma regulatory factor